MPSLSKTARTLSSLGLIAAAVPVNAGSNSQRPIYAIVQRVLTIEGVKAALSHGANAIEVDLVAWEDWWADHDGDDRSAGATARDLFTYIAKQRKKRKNISFVWLDIKNPERCPEKEMCSILALRELVRGILESAGVRALYGFYLTEGSEGYNSIRDSLNRNEAICLSGYAKTVVELYDNFSPSLPANQRIMEFGEVDLGRGFGDCHKDDGKICSELCRGRDARNEGKLGKVLAWTSTEGDAKYVNDLLGVTGVDGIIYGFQEDDYRDEPQTKAAFKDIFDWVSAHSATHRMATTKDIPW
ncbi:hypothetical protein BBP40_000847 [Aspergillus hancockii]|nr:hypothetical protein BBP40_000847 [Aspergillus hancockii]